MTNGVGKAVAARRRNRKQIRCLLLGRRARSLEHAGLQGVNAPPTPTGRTWSTFHVGSRATAGWSVQDPRVADIRPRFVDAMSSGRRSVGALASGNKATLNETSLANRKRRIDRGRMGRGPDRVQ